MTYSAKQRAEAVRLYIEEGASAAAQKVGCSRASVYLWLAELGTVESKKGQEARLATAERLALKRGAMLEAFHDKALELVAAIDSADPATTRFALASCQLADKALMMGGLLKKASDPARLSLAELEQWIAELEEQRGRVAPPDDRRADIDRELERMAKEMERSIRAEVLAEFDRELSASVIPPERVAIAEKVIARTLTANGQLEDPPADSPPKRRHRPEPGEVGPSW